MFAAAVWIASDDDAAKEVDTPTKDRTTTHSIPKKPAITQPKMTFYVAGSVVNVRSGPGITYSKLTQLAKAADVKWVETSGDWTKIAFNGKEGWMASQYLSRTRPLVQPVTTQRVSTNNRCHSSYSGACVPIASDVDCAGGSGNGPAYVHGPVRVVGRDVYRLDRDKDGIGCE